ncbi:DUF4837 family protein [Proteiniphilum acetatigenes]|uniref:DUF4837 family protein n=1 Tax=Proteiniphilum acetatigenes TaxID=294710 RepID=UPI000360E3FD|nr:DUF4837 family protein [Proteiniphilum acetatigenes]SFL22100.1 protein of unknown function [Porphyromonadaceae bacterium KH3CP3RA]
MKRYAVLPVILALLALFTSCDGGSSFFSASGTTNEVIVIMDENAWEGTAGRALFGVLNSNVKALPQAEPNFRILQLSPENFTSTFKMARNLIIPEISNIYSYPKLTADLDKYAMGQVIMNIHAPDTVSFVEFVTENRESIIDYFVTKELERNARYLKNQIKEPVSRVKQVFGINIHFPKGLPNISEHENFYWATNNAARGRQDIVIYQFPYTTETVFEKDSLINIRNRVLGEYITGSFDSRMMTATVYSPDYRKMETDGLFRAELRGLWEMTNDMMGGPFVMHAFVNENTGMVVIVEVFVYAPEMNKRNLLRNLESTLYTISIPEKEEEKTS